jgi:hypothetical protein
MSTSTEVTMNSPSNTTSSKDFAAAAETKYDNRSDKHFGLVIKQYIKTFHGIIHDISPTQVRLLSNIVLVDRVLLLLCGIVVFADRMLRGNQGAEMSKMEIVFHRCNFIAAAITARFFWNRVPSSSITEEERSIAPRVIQKANQGRGVVAMLLFPIFPLVCRYMPQNVMESGVFAKGLAVTLMAGSASIYHLMKDYENPALWLLYGMTPMTLGLSILCCSDHTGSVASVLENYPSVMDRYLKESSFVICCAQVTCLQYYLYSRNLFAKSTVQKVCTIYQITIGAIFLYQFTTDAGGNVPWPMIHWL